MKPILFEAENYFNDLSLTKKSKKIPEGINILKKVENFGFNFVYNSASPWPYWCTGTAEQNKFEPRLYKDRQNKNVCIFSKSAGFEPTMPDLAGLGKTFLPVC